MPTYQYRIDGSDVITSVTDDWWYFARENGAFHLTPGSVVGRSIWAFVTGDETTFWYREIFGKVRTDHHPIVVPFRCDSPTCRRDMRLTVSPEPAEALELTARVEREKAHAPIRLLDPDSPRSDSLVTMCSWCKAVRASEGEWETLENALARLNLLAVPDQPGITHGICPGCEETLVAQLSQ